MVPDSVFRAEPSGIPTYSTSGWVSVVVASRDAADRPIGLIVLTLSALRQQQQQPQVEDVADWATVVAAHGGVRGASQAGEQGACCTTRIETPG